MVKFDELRISGDGQYLTVACHVENYDVYSEMYIESIYLEYYKDRKTIGVPSDKALLLFENTSETPTDVRAFRKKISTIEIPGNFANGTFERGLFYVYVNCGGNLPASVSMMGCGYDVTLDIALIPDWKALYKFIMPAIASFASNCSGCELPENLEHLILLWHAFKFAVDTCDWNVAERIWNELMGISGVAHSGSGSGCGCFKF